MIIKEVEEYFIIQDDMTTLASNDDVAVQMDELADKGYELKFCFPKRSLSGNDIVVFVLERATYRESD